MIGFIAVLFLLLAPGPAGAEVLGVRVTAAPDPTGSLPDPAALQAATKKLFDAQLGSIVSLDVSGAPAASSATVTVELSGDQVVVTSDFTQAGSMRSLVSHVPRGSLASLVATMSGDLAFLYFSARGFSALPLSPPPALVGAISTDALGALTGWNPEDLEPLGITGHGDEITICFPHRYLTLGPLFEVTSDTVRDLNAQSLAAEPLQLSGVVASGGRLSLLSEQAGSIVVVDPRLGSRTVAAAPGLSALPARSLGPDGVICLPGSSGAPGLRVYSSGGGEAQTLPVLASYLSALDKDREGNLWVWDAGERRIRIITPAGQEVYAIRPLQSASTMPLPQQIAVFDDGSFLLAGSSEVWKFQSSGIPVWRLARIPGRPGESLPPVFDLGVDRSRGSFTILDQQSRRLLAFSPTPSEDELPLAALLARLDARKSGDLGQASALARGRGLSLMAYAFADSEARTTGSERDQGPSRIALLSEKAARYKDFADGLDRDLLLERADGAYLRAAESLRELAAEAPGDEQAAALLQDVLARRREVRAQLAGPRDVQIVSAVLRAEPDESCAATASLSLRLRNSGTQALRALRVHVSVPSHGIAPALAAIESLLPSEERELVVPLGPVVDGDTILSSPAPAYALVTYEQGELGVSTALTFSAAPVRAEGPGLARTLACRAVAQDTLTSTLSYSLHDGSRPASPSTLADLAGVLDTLGAARTMTRAAGPRAPGPDSSGPPSMRAALRALSTDEADWTVVTASVAAGMGLSSAILWRGGRPLALVDTGVPFPRAFDAVPALQPFHHALAGISPADTLWVPLSGRVPPRTPHPALWAVAVGLEALSSADTVPGDRADMAATDPAMNAPVPFPLVVPALSARMSIDELTAAVEQAVAAGAALNDPLRQAPPDTAPRK